MTTSQDNPNHASPPTKKMKALGVAVIDVLQELKSKSMILGLESEVDNGEQSLVIVSAMLATENRMEYAIEMSALHKSLIKKFREAEKS